MTQIEKVTQKKDADLVPMPIRVKPELKKKVEHWADIENRSMNQQVVQFIEDGISKLEQEAAL